MKIYAMYVDNKNATYAAIKNDSSAYYYAGYSADIKNVFTTLRLNYIDSMQRANWSKVYGNNSPQDVLHLPVIKGTIVRQQIMPDIRGMGLKDVLYLLENIGVKVAARGKGKVVSQSVQAGTVLSRGLTVYVELG